MNELVAGAYAGLIANLAAAAVINNTLWEDPSATVWLVTLGTVNELLGVLLVASPELLPRLHLAGRWLVKRAADVRIWSVASVRRVFRRRRNVTVQAGMAGSVALSGSATLRRFSGPPPGATSEETMAWLVARDHANQELFQDIKDQIEGLPALWHADISAAQAELEGFSRALVRSVADARIRLRLIGLAYVVIGLLLSWVGNLL